MDEFYEAVQCLPGWLSQPLAAFPPETAGQIHEIRLRQGCPPGFTISGRPCPAGAVPGCPAEVQKLVMSAARLEETFYTLCGGSVHTHQDELAEGYLTLPGGHRVGVAGTFFLHPQQGAVMQTVRSLNLRIARRKEIALPPPLKDALDARFVGMVLVGEPDSGKTTLLRSMARYLAAQGRAVSVVDERRELFPETEGPGQPFDVIAGLPKGRALQMALRTLSPQVILLDELGGLAEVEQLEQGFLGGVDFVASLHAADLEEAFRRPQIEALCRRQMLRVLVGLEGREHPGQIKEVRWI